MNVQTRPFVPIEERTKAEHWITDETAAEARRLWSRNPKANAIECALIVATEAIRPLVEGHGK